MDTSRSFFDHFDGAMIGFNIYEKEKLFRDNNKLKGGNYQKSFFIRRPIEWKEVYELSNRFFPLDELIDEYFEVASW